MLRLLLVLLAISATTVAARAQQRPADEAAVRELVRQYVNARELKDPSSIGALFTADADQHTTAGEWRRGRDAIVSGTLSSSQRNPGQRNIAVASVRFVTADVAIADGPYTITAAGNTRRMWTTIVAVRQEGKWRISAIRNAAPTGQ